MSRLLPLFLNIVLLVAKISDITYPANVAVIVHRIRLKGLESLLLSLERIGFRIPVLMIPLLTGEMEA